MLDENVTNLRERQQTATQNYFRLSLTVKSAVLSVSRANIGHTKSCMLFSKLVHNFGGAAESVGIDWRPHELTSALSSRSVCTKREQYFCEILSGKQLRFIFDKMSCHNDRELKCNSRLTSAMQYKVQQKSSAIHSIL